MQYLISTWDCHILTCQDEARRMPVVERQRPQKPRCAFEDISIYLYLTSSLLQCVLFRAGIHNILATCDKGGCGYSDVVQLLYTCIDQQDSMAVGPSPHTSNRKVTFTQHTHFQIPRSHAHNIHRWGSCGPHYKFCSHQLRSVFCHNKVAMAALNGCYGCHNKMAMATETSLVMLHSM